MIHINPKLEAIIMHDDARPLYVMWRDHACEHLAPQGLAQKIDFGSDRVYFPPGVPILDISGTTQSK